MKLANTRSIRRPFSVKAVEEFIEGSETLIQSQSILFTIKVSFLFQLRQSELDRGEKILEIRRRRFHSGFDIRLRNVYPTKNIGSQSRDTDSKATG